tara:strand:+ start:187 stop:402 length:216 start_codon:yes stop_codon:yes gene_type:complete
MSHFGDLIGVSSPKPKPPVLAPDPVIEEKPLDFDKMSKSELELYGRTIGIELDRRHSKTKLIKELEEKLSE